jgi:hypothetical protein
MKAIFIIAIFMELLLVSCSKQTGFKDFIHVDLNKSITISDSKLLLKFNNKYPTDIAVKDSLIILLFAQEDTCGAVYNLNTRQCIDQFGVVGNGPGELIDLGFVTNKEYALKKDSLYFMDMNRRRILAISLGMQDRHFALNDLMNYPGAINPSEYPNITNDIIVGRKIETGGNNMFYIYQRKNQNMQMVNCFPMISDIKDKNRNYAPHLALNEIKGKIIAGMYFMDIIHVYNVNGEREKTIGFSEQCIPPVKRGSFDRRKGFSGIDGIYPTDNYCYVKRRQVQNNGSQKITKTTLLKLDWEGNLITSYSFKEPISGKFCIDETSNKFYCLQNVIEADNADYWNVVYYDLN